MYGRGDGLMPCQCDCFENKCSVIKGPNKVFDYYNLNVVYKKHTETKMVNKEWLAAKISKIGSIGELLISFNSTMNTKLVKGKDGQFDINNTMIEMYIEPYYLNFDNNFFDPLKLNLTWNVTSYSEN